MVRRVIEEDVPSTTVVEDDGSWIGRTLVTLVVLALLVAGAIWLVQNLGDNDGGGGGNTPNIENNETNIENNTDNNNDGGTGGESADPTSTQAP